jgi:hypothetical protein
MFHVGKNGVGKLESHGGGIEASPYHWLGTGIGASWHVHNEWRPEHRSIEAVFNPDL